MFSQPSETRFKSLSNLTITVENHRSNADKQFISLLVSSLSKPVTLQTLHSTQLLDMKTGSGSRSNKVIGCPQTYRVTSVSQTLERALLGIFTFRYDANSNGWLGHMCVIPLDMDTIFTWPHMTHDMWHVTHACRWQHLSLSIVCTRYNFNLCPRLY